MTHRSAAAFVGAESELWEVMPEDRVLAGLSVAFDASCEEIWLAWGHGAALVPAPRQLVRSGVELGPWLAERAVTVISTVPTLATIWEEASLAAVRLLILGGEACPEPLAWRLAGRSSWARSRPASAATSSSSAGPRWRRPSSRPRCGRGIRPWRSPTSTTTAGWASSPRGWSIWRGPPAEIEAGSVISGVVGAGERWTGSPDRPGR